MVVGVGLVELEHGELGVVLGADAFVAEVAVDLVDAVEASDDEALEVELGRDAEGERDVEGVVVGLEGACGGSSGDGVHHGGFDFEVAAGVEEGADGAEDGGAFDEDFADVDGGFGIGVGDVAFGGLGAVAGVHEEVDVALAVAELGVFQAVVLVGQGEHGLGEEGEGGAVVDGGDVDGELAGAGAEEEAADADVVAEVEEFVEGEGVVADVVLADVDLEALAALLELGEAGFALDADGHDAAGDGDADGGRDGVELFGGEGVVGGAELGDGVGGVVAVGVGREAERGDVFELLAAQVV